MKNINAEINRLFNDKRLYNCQILVSDENVLIEQQIIYSLLESIEALDKAQKEKLQCAS